MTDDKEHTPIEVLESERDEAIEKLRQGRELEKQRTVLRPQLVKREAVLDQKIAPLQAELARVTTALLDIDEGNITDYRLRKPRKAKGAQPPGDGSD